MSDGGSVEFARVLAGFTTNETPANGNASIGAVRVGDAPIFLTPYTANETIREVA